MPRSASAGECYAQVYMPPEFKTATERVCVREESEKIEVVPAQYEWVEEKVLVREASTQLVEVPAQFASENQVVETSPGFDTWVKADQAQCRVNTAGPAPQDIFCLMSEPASSVTVAMERLVKPAGVKEVGVPAQYETVRKQKLVRPATTKRVRVPAEYREIEKTVMTSPGRMEWQRVECGPNAFNPKAFQQVRDRNR